MNESIITFDLSTPTNQQPTQSQKCQPSPMQSKLQSKPTPTSGHRCSTKQSMRASYQTSSSTEATEPPWHPSSWAWESSGHTWDGRSVSETERTWQRSPWGTEFGRRPIPRLLGCVLFLSVGGTGRFRPLGYPRTQHFGVSPCSYGDCECCTFGDPGCLRMRIMVKLWEMRMRIWDLRRCLLCLLIWPLELSWGYLFKSHFSR